MRRLFIFLMLLAVSTVAAAQDRRANADWKPSPRSGCIGGSTCPERRLRVELEDKPVLAVRFRAHDQIGTKAEGVLRMKIDGNTVDGHIDIPRRGETFTVEVDELRGRYLVFEPATNDEVEISEVAVLYGSTRRVPPRRDDYDNPRGPRGGGPRGGGWRSYPGAAACIGGDECRRNGDRITIALDDAPVL